MWDKPEWLNRFNQKGFCYSYTWSCSLCERRTSYCKGFISRKLYGFLLIFSTGFTSLSILLLFPLSITFVFMYAFWFYLYNIDEVLSINPRASVFVFRDFKVHHKDWPGVLCIIFPSQMTSLRWLTFLLRSLTVTLTLLLFRIYLFLLMLEFAVQWLSLHWEILIILLTQFPLTFQQNQKGMPCFIA